MNMLALAPISLSLKAVLATMWRVILLAEVCLQGLETPVVQALLSVRSCCMQSAWSATSLPLFP